MQNNTLLKSTLIIAAVFIVIFAIFAFIDVKTSGRRKENYKSRTVITAYLMLLPAVGLAFMFILLPILYSLGYAFTDYYLFEPENIKFNGLDNFRDVFNDIAKGGDLYRALVNTAAFVVGVVPLQIGLALGLALFVNKPLKGSKIFKVCFFAPVVISLSVTSMLWVDILSGSETGLLNSVTALFGAEPRDWMRDSSTAIPCIIVLSAWQGCGYQMLIFLSGLSNIRQELYEAAALDGAGAWKKFTLVTWPGLRPTFAYILITVFIGACRVLAQPMIMTGYKDHTKTLAYYMYQTGLKKRWVGLSSAVALLMTIVIGAITLIQRRILREKD